MYLHLRTISITAFVYVSTELVTCATERSIFTSALFTFPCILCLGFPAVYRSYRLKTCLILRFTKTARNTGIPEKQHGISIYQKENYFAVYTVCISKNTLIPLKTLIFVRSIPSWPTSTKNII